MSQTKTDFEVILGNSNKNFSGVTSTMLQTLDIQAEIMSIAVLGKHHLPAQHRSKAISFFSLAMRSRKLLPSGKYRVFHARRNDEMIQALALKYLFKSKIKVVFTSTAQRHHSWLTKWLIKRMDCVISTCNAAAAYLDTAPAIIIPHGIQEKKYKPDPEKKANEITVAMFGRVREQKGTHLFVRACIKNFKIFDDVKAVIIGGISKSNQTFVENLKKEIFDADLSDRIQFLGEQDFADIPVFFQSASIVAALSNNEGFGLTVLEAMSSGAAVLATKAGAWPEIVEQGVQGYIVPINDQSAVDEKLQELLADREKLKEMGIKGRERVIKYFSLQHEAERLCELYKSLQ